MPFSSMWSARALDYVAFRFGNRYRTKASLRCVGHKKGMAVAGEVGDDPIEGAVVP